MMAAERQEAISAILGAGFRAQSSPLAREWVRYVEANRDRPFGETGTARILLDGDIWKPYEHGINATISPIYHVDSELWRALVWRGLMSEELASSWLSEVVDLVAWHPSTPDKWARRTGLGEYLGDIAVEHLDGSAPLRVWRTPYAWHRSGQDGICLLSKEPLAVKWALSLLSERSVLVPEDREHGAELRRMLTRQLSLPRISV